MSDRTRAMPYRAAYGSGIYVRSLAIRSPEPGRVSLAMEDPVHAFRIDFAHRDDVVTAIQGVWMRQPLSSCALAPEALAEAMVGCRLSDNVFDVARQTDAATQCTHLYDMFCLAATHAHARRADCRYDVTVPDALDGPRQATLARNGETLLTFAIDDNDTIVEPAACRGIGVLKGFMAWVRANVPAHQHEHYFIMQRALFVARSQRIDIESLIGEAAKASGPAAGTCFGSQPHRYETARRIGVVKRFDRDTIGDALSFFEPL
ncbi:hypothetical protein [Paraburkholderia bannensis]|uniref:hypothetical protein n=1 Tax=Paraburkholderia bannensis TaxID=765414 RepID=UPI002AB7AA75|nr:hypothetical protein [Paraburkholderia bannensis]